MDNRNNCTNEITRKRNRQKKIWVTEEEEKMIKEKMKISGYDNFNEYAVRMLIDGFIFIEEFDNFIKVSEQLTEIGNQINKIAHRADTIELQEERMRRGEVVEIQEPPITIADIKAIDKWMEKIFKTMNTILKESRGTVAVKKNRQMLKDKINGDEKKKN